MRKGTDTREAILRQALDQSSALGLEGISLGGLAKSLGMSKSGLYAHFESKIDLQVHVLDSAAERFKELVITPSLSSSRGLPRLRALFDLWLRWGKEVFPGGCPFVSAAMEFDDRPGPVRVKLQGHQSKLLQFISRMGYEAMDEGHFDQALDLEQFVYDFWGILLAAHYYHRLMQRDDAEHRALMAFDTLIHLSEPS